MTRSKLAVAAVSGLAFATTAAIAHMAASGIVKERMDLMESMGRSSKLILLALRRDGALDRPAIAAAAERIRAESRQMLRTFPPGSHRDPSEALPEVWSQWEEFSASARDLEAASAELAAAAEGGDRDGLSDRFDRMVRVCIACHRAFRKPRG